MGEKDKEFDYARICSFQEHFDDMRDLGRDVKELKGIYGVTAASIQGLNTTLARIDSDVAKSLETLNRNMERGIEVATSLINVSRMIVVGFILAIVALVTQVASVDLDLWGLKIHTTDLSRIGKDSGNGGNQATPLAAPAASVGAATERRGTPAAAVP